MTRERIETEYFNWLFDLVCADHRSNIATHHKLLSHLHDREFTYLISNDADRAEEGRNSRITANGIRVSDAVWLQKNIYIFEKNIKNIKNVTVYVTEQWYNNAITAKT